MAIKSSKSAKKKVAKKKVTAKKKAASSKKKATKKVAASKKTTKKTARRPITAKPGMAPKQATPKEATKTFQPVSAAERHQMIATMAYYRWERRGRVPGFEQEDWLESEKAVEAMLKNRQR